MISTEGTAFVYFLIRESSLCALAAARVLLKAGVPSGDTLPVIWRIRFSDVSFNNDIYLRIFSILFRLSEKSGSSLEEAKRKKTVSENIVSHIRH